MSSFYHNKGQKDYAAGNGYHPPYGDDLHSDFGDLTDKQIRDNKDYKEGWEHAREQSHHRD